MAENEIPITIDIETKGAAKDLDAFERNVSKSVGGLEKTFGLLKLAAGAAVAVFAGKQLIDGLSRAVKEASEADEAIAKLNLSLASTGEFSEEASLSLQEYADNVEATTIFNGDAVVSALALAKTFGITNEQAKNLTDAALDLSAATGQDLDTSVNQLGATFSGTAGRLAKLSPEFKNLTEEQLQAGDAIDIVRQKYDGFAEGLTKTFSGAIIQAENSYGKIFEATGRIITQNPVVIAIINKASEAFVSLGKFIDDNREAISTYLSKGLQAIVSAIPPIIRGLSFLAGAFEVVTEVTGLIVEATLKLTQFLLDGLEPVIRTVADAVLRYYELIFSGLARLVSGLATLGDNIPGVSKTFQDFGVDLKDVGKAADNLSDGALKRFREGNQDTITAVLDLRKSLVSAGIDATKDAAKGFGVAKKSLDDFANSVESSLEGIGKIDPASKAAGVSLKNNINAELFDKNKALLNELNNIGKGQLDQIKNTLSLELERLDIQEARLKAEGLLTGELESQLEIQRDLQKQLAEKKTEELGKVDIIPKGTIDQLRGAVGEGAGDFAQGINSGFSSFAGGVAGITGLVTGILNFAQQIIDFLPNLLSKVSNLFNSLAELPSRLLSGFKDLLKSILNAVKNFIPDLIENIGEIISEAVVFLAEKLPEAIEGLIDRLPEVITELIDRLPDILPKFITALIEAQPRIAVALIDAFILKGGAIKIGVAIAKAMAIEVPKAIIKGTVDGITKAGIQFGRLFSDGTKRAFTGIGSRLAGEFVNGIKSFFNGIGPKLALVFTGAGTFLASTLSNAFASIGALFSQRLAGAFTQGAQNLFNGIVNGFNTILSGLGTAFTQGASEVFNAIFQGALILFQEAFEGLKRGGTKVFNEIISGFKNGGNFIFEKLKEAFNIFGDFVEKLKDAVSGGGGGTLGKIAKGDFGGAVEDIKNVGKGKIKVGGGGGRTGLGFASGGLIPSGFPNDTFPARLTSGELVVPTAMVTELGNFLNKAEANQSGPNQDLIVALLSQITALLNRPMSVETKAEINNKEFANIILNLSRSNARLSA